MTALVSANFWGSSGLACIFLVMVDAASTASPKYIGFLASLMATLLTQIFCSKSFIFVKLACYWEGSNIGTHAYRSVMAGANNTMEEDGPAMAGDTGKNEEHAYCRWYKGRR